MEKHTEIQLADWSRKYMSTNPECTPRRHYINGMQEMEKKLLPVINKLEEENRWIEVSETSPTPEYNRGLLVIVQDGGYDFAVPAMLDAGSGKEKWIKLDDYTDLEAPQQFEGVTDYPKVTHWRYAPEGPKK